MAERLVQWGWVGCVPLDKLTQVELSGTVTGDSGMWGCQDSRALAMLRPYC